MNRPTRLLLVATLCTAATLPMAQRASAAATSPLPASQQAAVHPAAAVTPLKLKASFIKSGNLSGSALPAGYTTLDTTKINCASTTCTISFTIQGEAGGQSAAGTLWAICAQVDGAYVANACPYVGELPTDSTYLTSTQLATASVSSGKHTLSAQIYVSALAYAGVYQVNYGLLTP